MLDRGVDPLLVSCAALALARQVVTQSRFAYSNDASHRSPSYVVTVHPLAYEGHGRII